MDFQQFIFKTFRKTKKNLKERVVLVKGKKDQTDNT